jgi:hypothetical protein
MYNYWLQLYIQLHLHTTTQCIYIQVLYATLYTTSTYYYSVTSITMYNYWLQLYIQLHLHTTTQCIYIQVLYANPIHNYTYILLLSIQVLLWGLSVALGPICPRLNIATYLLVRLYIAYLRTASSSVAVYLGVSSVLMSRPTCWRALLHRVSA